MFKMVHLFEKKRNKCLFAFILFFSFYSFNLLAEEENNSKSEEASEEKKKSSAKKPKPEGELEVSSNRVKINILNVSKFGANRVEALVTYQFFFETDGFTTAQMIYDSLPRLKSAIVIKLTEFLSKQKDSESANEKIKKLLLKICENLFGKGKVKNVLLNRVFERKL